VCAALGPAGQSIIERALLLEVSVVPDPAYQAGGCWLAIDRDHLPPRLAALADQFDRAPPLIAVRGVERQVISARPRRLAVGLDPMRAQVMGYMAQYMGRCPARFVR
jgi:hypothetical protein